MHIHKQFPRDKQQGFTLIELMIVVGIIAVLAGIAIPLYMKYMARAEKSAAFSKLSSLTVYMDAYHAENDMFCDQCNVNSVAPDGYTYGFSTDDNGTVTDSSLLTLYPGLTLRPQGDNTPLAYHYQLGIIVINCTTTGCEEAVTYSALAQEQRGTAAGDIVLQYD